MKIIRFTSVDALRDEICKSGLEQFVVVKLDDRKVTVLTASWANRPNDPPIPVFLWKHA